MDDTPVGDLQSKQASSLSKFLICKNILHLGSLPIISSCDPTEINNTLNQVINDHNAGLSESSSQLKPFVSLSFSLTDKSAQFSILDQQSGEILQKFCAEKIAYHASRCIDTRGYVVITHPLESDILNSSASKQQYYCYVYQCSSAFESGRIEACIGELVRRTVMPSSMPAWKASSQLPTGPAEYNVCLRLHIDIREADTKSPLGSISVPKEKQNLFKFRQNLEKTLVIGVSQPEEGVDLFPLRVAKCLNIGLAYGRFLDPTDVTELVTNPPALSPEEATALIPEASVFVTKAVWLPRSPAFANLNTVTDRECFVFFTVVCNLVLEFVSEPVRLGCVCRAKILQKDPSLWLLPPRRPCSEDFSLRLVETVDEEKGWILMNRLSIVSISSAFSDVIRSLSSTQTAVARKSPKSGSASPVAQDAGAEDLTDDDEPLMSGNGGDDLRTITDDELYVAWGALVTEWRSRLQTFPSSATSLPPWPSAESALLRSGAEIIPDGALGRRIRQLVRRGIPDALRTEIWQMLAGYQGADPGLTEAYRILLTKPCRFDMDIQRDLPRTFPAHEFFKDQAGQEILFQLTRAYALYDETVGYCQGISFIAAALLLHMPEEQAFCLLVKIMSTYGTRLFFLQNCEGLLRCLHQFECLLQDQLPDVAKAFEDLGVKAHMYASQWFLTLFMTKFPLNLVFRIFDIFLTEGLLFVFKVMISLLRLSRRSLLGLDFEGTLKYFRVTLPKRFRSHEACDELISMACAAKVSGNRLNRYAREWERSRLAEAEENSPLVALQREVWQLREHCGRLEKENDNLADNVLVSKTEMQNTIDKLEDKVETLSRELLGVRQELVEKQEECELFERDSATVKTMFRDALNKHEEQMAIIAEYRTITANLSRRVEEAVMAETSQPRLSQVVVDAILACNGVCRHTLDEQMPGWPSRSAIFNDVCAVDVAKEVSEVEALRRHIKELELELARSKVSLVDAECGRQELSHQLMRTTAELEEFRATREAAFTHNPKQWLAKKWTTATSRGNGNATSSAVAPPSIEFSAIN